MSHLEAHNAKSAQSKVVLNENLELFRIQLIVLEAVDIQMSSKFECHYRQIFGGGLGQLSRCLMVGWDNCPPKVPPLPPPMDNCPPKAHPLPPHCRQRLEDICIETLSQFVSKS